jgi:ADP-heptose:LPS heptosyltransferase
LKIDKNKVRKILVIKFGGIGDVVLFTPVLPNIHEYFPNAEITVLIEKKAKDIIEGNPNIHNYITFTSDTKNNSSIYKEIRKYKFDLVFDFYGNPRTALITYFSNAKYRVGFDFRLRKYLYNIKANGYSSNIHNLDFNLRLLETINIPVNTKKIFVHTNEINKQTAADWFRKTGANSKQIISIVVCGGWESKIYRPKDYIELLKTISRKYNVNYLLIWGNKQERLQCEEINNGIGDNCFIVPELDLKTLTEFFKYCTVMIGNDSGPLHLSVTSGNPVLEICGPINPLLQGPYGEINEYVYIEDLDCIFCNLLECPIGSICLTDLPKSKIMISFEKLLAKNNIMLERKETTKV